MIGIINISKYTELGNFKMNYCKFYDSSEKECAFFAHATQSTAIKEKLI